MFITCFIPTANPCDGPLLCLGIFQERSFVSASSLDPLSCELLWVVKGSRIATKVHPGLHRVVSFFKAFEEISRIGLEQRVYDPSVKQSFQWPSSGAVVVGRGRQCVRSDQVMSMTRIQIE